MASHLPKELWHYGEAGTWTLVLLVGTYLLSPGNIYLWNTPKEDPKILVRWILRGTKKDFIAEEEFKTEQEKFYLGQGSIIFLEKVFVGPPNNFNPQFFFITMCLQFAGGMRWFFISLVLGVFVLIIVWDIIGVCKDYFLKELNHRWIVFPQHVCVS